MNFATGSNSEFYFPETLNVPRGEAKLKNRKKNCEEIVCLTPSDSQICRGFKEPDLITYESKVHVVFPWGVSEILLAQVRS